MIQAGIFGLGPNSSLNQWVGRADLSYQPLWQLEAFGIGNLARIKEQRGNESMAIIEFFKTQDMVAADVTRAQARVQSAAARVLQADRALRTGIITFNGNFEGLRADNPSGRRPGPGQPAAGGGLRPPALEGGLRRVLHHSRRLQRGSVRAVPRAGLPRSRGHGAPATRRGSYRWTRPGRPICPPWATARPRQADERLSSAHKDDVGFCFLWCRRGFTHAPSPDHEVPSRSRAIGSEAIAQRQFVVDSPREPRGSGLPPGRYVECSWGRGPHCEKQGKQQPTGQYTQRNSTRSSKETNIRVPRVPHHEPEPVQQPA